MTEYPRELAGLEIPEDELVFNGVDADSGSYLFARTRLEQVARVIRAQQPDPEHVANLEARERAETEKKLTLAFGRNPTRLDEAGWALVVADDIGPEIVDALAPLRDWRRQQAGELYRELSGPADGVHVGEDSQDFLIRHGVAPNDVADPRQLPYYVLLVGGPDHVPFSLQYQLGLQRAVGRLHFDTAAEYARYAENVVTAETSPPPIPSTPRVHVFATRNPGDFPTALSSSRLADPLVQDLKETAAEVDADIGETATKQRLNEIFTSEERLDLLFTATHGVAKSGQGQRDMQGALLCQEWQGPVHEPKPLAPAEYFGAGDLDSSRPVSATVIFSFGCYSAGTPHMTDFIDMPTPAASADPPFVARLAQQLLSHPRGGCLAFVGHVDRAWNCSFLWKGIQPRILPFTNTISAFLSGLPLGLAMEYVSARYATTATQLVDLLHQTRAWGRVVDDRELANLWIATNDARNFLLVGDPAIRRLSDTPDGPGH
jgi:hypothetical protein